MASAFQPDYDAGYTNGNVVEAGPYRLYGVGTYVDIKLSRWIQLEGEARWMRFNQFDQIYQDNYLGGYRYPFRRYHILRTTVTPYVKGLIGYSKMGLGNVLLGSTLYSLGTGGFTDIAFGGGADFRLTKKFTFRGDFEYQDYPKFLSNNAGQIQHLYPYGASVGVGYKIF